MSQACLTTVFDVAAPAALHIFGGYWLPAIDCRFDPRLLRAVNSYGEPVNGRVDAKPLIFQPTEAPYRFGAVNSLQRKRASERRKRGDFGAAAPTAVNGYCRDTAQTLGILPERLPARETVLEEYWRREGRRLQTFSCAISMGYTVR